MLFRSKEIQVVVIRFIIVGIFTGLFCVNSGNVISVEEEIVEFQLNIEQERGSSPLNASFDFFMIVNEFLPKNNLSLSAIQLFYFDFSSSSEPCLDIPLLPPELKNRS